MSIGIFIAPVTAPQTSEPCQPWPAPGPSLTEHELRLLAVVKKSERQKIAIWDMVNTIVCDLAPRSRRDLRYLRVRLLCSLGRLLRLGRLQREGRDFIKLADVPVPIPARSPAPQPVPPARTRVFEV